MFGIIQHYVSSILLLCFLGFIVFYITVDVDDLFILFSFRLNQFYYDAIYVVFTFLGKTTMTINITLSPIFK